MLNAALLLLLKMQILENGFTQSETGRAKTPTSDSGPHTVQGAVIRPARIRAGKVDLTRLLEL